MSKHKNLWVFSLLNLLWLSLGLLSAAGKATQLDTVNQQEFRLIGTDQPLALGTGPNDHLAYIITLRPSDARALRTAKLGYDGNVFLVTPTPEKLGQGGKLSATIRLGNNRNSWRQSWLVSAGTPISIRKRNEIASERSFVLIHTREAQYLIANGSNMSPQIIETLGLSHLPTGSILTGTKAPILGLSTMVYLATKDGRNHQVYIRKYH